MGEKRKLYHPEKLGIICILFIMLGCFLPWQILEIMDKTTIYWGYEYDGKILFVFAVIILGFLYLGYIKNKRIQSAIGMLAFNTFILLEIYVIIIGVEEVKSTIWIKYSHSYSIGIYLIAIGGVGLIFSCLWQIGEAYKQKTKIGEIQPRQHRDRYCPKCGRNIPFDAVVCPYCGKKFKDYFPTDENVKTEKFVEDIVKVQEEKKMKSCPSCGYENKPTSKFCTECGAKLGE